MEARPTGIVAKLEALAELKAAAEKTRLGYESKREQILRKVQCELEELDAEYQPLFDAATQRITDLEADIKQDVVQHGSSVKGSQWHAVYIPGRVTWDTKGLSIYAISHPEIAAFRKVGKPSVSLRAVRSASREGLY